MGFIGQDALARVVVVCVHTVQVTCNLYTRASSTSDFTRMFECVKLEN